MEVKNIYEFNRTIKLNLSYNMHALIFHQFNK